MAVDWVVDFHVHAGNPEDWHPWVMEFISVVNPEAEGQLDEVQTQEGMHAFLDGQGVDHAVILAETSPVTTGVVSNARVRSLCEGSPRLTPFASFHPLEVDDMGLTVRALANEGFRGLKFYPSSQFFYPDDPRLVVGWVTVDPAAAREGLARKLPHYGKYSWLAFAGEEYGARPLLSRMGLKVKARQRAANGIEPGRGPPAKPAAVPS